MKGFWTLEYFETHLEGFTMGPLTCVLGWTKDQVYVLCAKVRNEMKDITFSVFWEM